MLSRLIKITISLLLIVTPLTISWGAENVENKALDHITLGIDFGWGFPYEWAQNDNSSSKWGARYNLNTGIRLGYDFEWITIYRSYKFGPEIGINYGFTRALEFSEKESLREKYLNFPVTFKCIRYIEEEGLSGKDYFGMGLSLGYEFNFLLSSVYNKKKDTVDLLSSSQPPKDSRGFTLDVPRLTGSIIADGIIYINSIYLGVKVRVPKELLGKKGLGSEHSLSAEFIRKSRIKTASLMEFYIGINIIKCL